MRGGRFGTGVVGPEEKSGSKGKRKVNLGGGLQIRTGLRISGYGWGETLSRGTLSFPPHSLSKWSVRGPLLVLDKGRKRFSRGKTSSLLPWVPTGRSLRGGEELFPEQVLPTPMRTPKTESKRGSSKGCPDLVPVYRMLPVVTVRSLATKTTSATPARDDPAGKDGAAPD